MVTNGDPVSLAIKKIRLDGGTQQRVEMSPEQIDRVEEAVRAGRPLEPVDVFRDGKTDWLAHGFHRVEGTRAAGEPHILATLHYGTLRDAILFSVGCNDVGLQPRTRADRDKCIVTMLTDKEWGTWSDAAIARQCKVLDAEIVARLRRHYRKTDSEKRTYTTKNGTTAEMDVSNIGGKGLAKLIHEFREAYRAGLIDDDDVDDLSAMSAEEQREQLHQGGVDTKAKPTHTGNGSSRGAALARVRRLFEEIQAIADGCGWPAINDAAERGLRAVAAQR